MKLERFTTGKENLYEAAIRLYESNFIIDERRDSDEQKRVLTDRCYHCCALIEHGEMVGIVFFWENDDFIYLEHLCINEDRRREGHGSNALDLLKSRGKTVILEIEPVFDEMTDKRRLFYEKNGFFLNSHLHIQPKYHIGDEDLILWIMSYGREISKAEYDAFYKFLIDRIQIQPVKTSDIQISPLTDKNDFEATAELIYYSDNYIYPCFCKCVETGKKIITKMIERNTLYRADNITIAKHNGSVVGILVSVKTPYVLSKQEYENSVKAAGVDYSAECERVWNEYYALMENETGGTYIANICVSSRYRGNRIAGMLLNTIFNSDSEFFLECVQTNEFAVKCYEKLGFKIIECYPGFTGIPCYRMKR